MSTEVSGMVECRPGARLWGPDDEDAIWHVAIDLSLLNNGNAYDALACLFGVRNHFGYRPLAEGRGFPNDASEGLRAEYAAYGGSPDTYGTTWITWAELASANWQETGRSGTRSRESVAGEESDWGPVWKVMRILGELHGADHVRIVAWFC
ncbi:hypothetical protein ACFY84_26135 [Streptomyces sp. NPDC012438]|uniref:hypothetical protein n=1 Tax=Streptomyces sp. NPDC012438 TaxID=3364833 RepID=UPI0036F08F74